MRIPEKYECISVLQLVDQSYSSGVFIFHELLPACSIVTNLHIFLTPFTHESRALKQSSALLEKGIFERVCFAVIWEEGLPLKEDIGNGGSVNRFRLRTRGLPKNLLSQTVKYCEWVLRILFFYKTREITVVHAHSLAALPVGVIYKFLFGKKLVYDAHELESERNGLKGIRKKLSYLFERQLIKWADASIVVSDAIADWYLKEYQVPRPIVIKNIPVEKTVRKKQDVKKQLAIEEGDILFIYQGAFSSGRGIENLLDVFAEMEGQRHQLALMGKGTLKKLVEKYAGKCSNIHCLPPVSPEDVLAYTSSADIGFSLIENTCLSYYYCLPNKFFEYILSGLPVIASDFPEMRSYVHKYDCGWLIPEGGDLKQLICSIKSSELEEKRSGVNNARAEICWEDESKKLIALYQELSGNSQ